MDSLINIINKLQDVFNTIGAETIELPQIVVVGNQSAGKSSVIEAIVGHDFLPRGAGIVTRCPLVLQLIQAKEPRKRFILTKKEDSQLPGGIEILNEWASFLHQPNKIYTDFSEVRKEIEDETERLSGGNKQISSKPITLKIYSNKVVNLTLVDLPGMTKLPVGDQPKDIEEQIRNLIAKYIVNPNSIILAVTPANIDFATSEALKLAKDFDPDGQRTLAVLTKLDLMDAGTDAVEVLLSRVIPVKLGIVGVVNRSQLDIINNKTISDAMKDEIAFLQKKYAALASQNGSTYLVKRLNSLLIEHIQEHLPDLKNRVRQKEAEQRALRESLGEALDGQHKKSNKLIQMITEFAQLYRSTIDSTGSAYETKELIGGARICDIFDNRFAGELDQVDPLDGLNDREIENLVRNSTGLSPALGVPQQALEWLIKRQLKKLVAPTLRCADYTFNELEEIVHQCASKMEQETALFPRMMKEILYLTREMLRDRLPVTSEMITNMLESELAYINFKKLDLEVYQKLVNPEKAKKELGVAGDKREVDSDEVDDNEQCQNVRKLVNSYFDGVREQLKDYVPKITVKFLVFYVKENLLAKLVDKLNRVEVLDDLLSEDKFVPLRRKEADEMLAALNKAQKIIGEIDHCRA